MKKIKLMVAICSVLAMASTANAASLADLLFLNQVNQLSDNSAEYLLNNLGGGLFATDNGDSIIATGDVLRGSFNIGTIENLSGGGPDNLVGTAGNDEVTGIFELQATVVDTGIAGPSRYLYSFAPTAAFEAIYGTGALLAVYDDPSVDFSRLSPPADDIPGNTAEETLMATATDGALAWVFGFTGAGGTAGAGEGWVASAFTNDVSVVAATPAGSNGGTVNLALNLLTDNLGIPLAKQTSIFDLLNANVVLNGSGNLLGILGATTPYNTFDNFDAVIRPEVVPEPGTLALVGFGLLGLGVFARRKFQK